MKKSLVPKSAWSRIAEATPDEGTRPLKNAKEIDIELIEGDPRQPRKYFDPLALEELTASVRERGILQPITVQRRPEGSGYFVVTGERRLRAARAAGLATVPAIVVDLEEIERRLDRVIENRQRKDLTDLEFARAIIEIRDDLGARAPNLTSNELDDRVGERLGLSGRTIRSFTALLNLDPAIEELLGDRLTELRARGLTRVGYDPDAQRALAEAIDQYNLSGRQTLAAAQMLKRNTGLTVDEAVARVLGAEQEAADTEESSGAAAAAPLVEAPADAPERALDPNDPLRRYWLLTTYLSRAAAVLDEPGADEEVPLNRQQVSDLTQLLAPLVRLHQALQPASAYIEGRREQGDDGYEGEPLPRRLAVMLPFGGPPAAATPVPTLEERPGRKAASRRLAQLRAVPK